MNTHPQYPRFDESFQDEGTNPDAAPSNMNPYSKDEDTNPNMPAYRPFDETFAAEKTDPDGEEVEIPPTLPPAPKPIGNYPAPLPAAIPRPPEFKAASPNETATRELRQALLDFQKLCTGEQRQVLKMLKAETGSSFDLQTLNHLASNPAYNIDSPGAYVLRSALRHHTESVRSAPQATPRDRQFKFDFFEAITLVNKGKPDQALVLFVKLVQQEGVQTAWWNNGAERSPDLLCWHWIGRCYFQLGDSEKALTAYQKALSYCPREMFLVERIQELTLRIQREQVAATATRPAISEQEVPAQTPRVTSRPFSRIALKKVPRPALKPAPPSAPELLRQAADLKEAGDFQGAIQAYEEALKIYPTLGEAHYQLAGLRERRGLRKAALFHLEQALKLGAAHRNSSYIQQAIDSLKPIIARDSQSLGTPAYLGKAEEPTHRINLIPVNKEAETLSGKFRKGFKGLFKK